MHSSNRFRSFQWLCLVAALASMAPRSARADVTAAARAFAEGQAAQLEGNYVVAAERFELAFALQPSKEALRSAARMQMSAANFARAATHAQALLDRFGDDAQSVELGRSILEEVAPQLVNYEVSCVPECALLVDKLAYFVDPARRHRLYLKPGRVSLEAHFASGRTASRTVTSSAGETTRLELKEPAAPAPTSGKRAGPEASQHELKRATPPVVAGAGGARTGVPVVIPWISGAATIACGAVTIWAALDTRRQHDEYVEHPTSKGWHDGIARQRMTNILAASTAVLGAATITLTLFVRSPNQTSVGISPALGPSSASMALAGSF